MSQGSLVMNQQRNNTKIYSCPIFTELYRQVQLINRTLLFWFILIELFSDAAGRCFQQKKI